MIQGLILFANRVLTVNAGAFVIALLNGLILCVVCVCEREREGHLGDTGDVLLERAEVVLCFAQLRGRVLLPLLRILRVCERE